MQMGMPYELVAPVLYVGVSQCALGAGSTACIAHGNAGARQNAPGEGV